MGNQTAQNQPNGTEATRPGDTRPGIFGLRLGASPGRGDGDPRSGKWRKRRGCGRQVGDLRRPATLRYLPNTQAGRRRLVRRLRHPQTPRGAGDHRQHGTRHRRGSRGRGCGGGESQRTGRRVSVPPPSPGLPRRTGAVPRLRRSARQPTLGTGQAPGQRMVCSPRSGNSQRTQQGGQTEAHRRLTGVQSDSLPRVPGCIAPSRRGKHPITK